MNNFANNRFNTNLCSVIMYIVGITEWCFCLNPIIFFFFLWIRTFDQESILETYVFILLRINFVIFAIRLLCIRFLLRSNHWLYFSFSQKKFCVLNLSISPNVVKMWFGDKIKLICFAFCLNLLIFVCGFVWYSHFSSLVFEFLQYPCMWNL